MKIKIEIDSSQLTDYTSISEDQKLADEFIGRASDGKIISEALSRQLVEEIVDGLTPMERDKLFDLYGYEKHE